MKFTVLKISSEDALKARVIKLDFMMTGARLLSEFFMIGNPV